MPFPHPLNTIGIDPTGLIIGSCRRIVSPATKGNPGVIRNPIQRLPTPIRLPGLHLVRNRIQRPRTRRPIRRPCIIRRRSRACLIVQIRNSLHAARMRPLGASREKLFLPRAVVPPFLDYSGLPEVLVRGSHDRVAVRVGVRGGGVPVACCRRAVRCIGCGAVVVGRAGVGVGHFGLLLLGQCVGVGGCGGLYPVWMLV